MRFYQPPEKPNPEIIQKYIDKFDNSDEGIGDRALIQLFEKFPDNTQLEHVLLKAMALNASYNTRVLNIHITNVANVIYEAKIDQRLKEDDPSLVGELLVRFKAAEVKQYYSFTTKYCSWHQPQKFPIYDSFVDKLLWQYQKTNQIAPFIRNKLWDYVEFKAIIVAFREKFGLLEYDFKKLDKFLWGYGRDYFKET